MTESTLTNVVLVCGGRDYTDKDTAYRVLDELHNREDGSDAGPITRIVHGGAKGADCLAGRWAAARGVECVVYPADWETHGKAAGPIRNAKMLKYEQPDMVVAFPGGKGTLNMVTLTVIQGIPLYIVNNWMNIEKV